MLLSASIFFGVRAESIRRSVQRASAQVETGDLLSFTKVQDGDTLLLTNGAGDAVTVRIVGIKAFDQAALHDPTARWAKEAVSAWEQSLTGKSVRLMLGTPPKDRHGRALATLFVDDADVALQLVRDGRVIVYTQYPFPAMSEYLRAQVAAQAEKKGLWSDPIVSDRARALAEQWKKGAP